MKKIFYLSALLAALTLFFGCASTKLAFTTLSPIAIIDVEGNAVIWTEADDFDYEAQEDEGGGILATATNKLIYSKSPELLTSEDRMNYAEESLRIALEDNGVKVLDKDSVVESKTYKYDILNILGVINMNSTADGYRKGLTSIPAKKARMLMDEIGANGLVSAEFYFTKKIEHKKAWPVVSMKILVQNRKGKKIFNKEFTAESTGSVQTYGAYDKYDKTEFVQLMNPLIDDVINRFAAEYLLLSVESTGDSSKTQKTEAKASSASATKLGKPKSSSETAKTENASATAEKTAKQATDEAAKEAAQDKAVETAKKLLGMGMDTTRVAKATGLSEEKVEQINVEMAKEKQAVETAKNLLKMGMEPEKISEATGLSVEKVNQLKEE